MANSQYIVKAPFTTNNAVVRVADMLHTHLGYLLNKDTYGDLYKIIKSPADKKESVAADISKEYGRFFIINNFALLSVLAKYLLN